MKDVCARGARTCFVAHCGGESDAAARFSVCGERGISILSRRSEKLSNKLINKKIASVNIVIVDKREQFRMRFDSSRNI